jgi:single-strand DNA-binding protein
MNVVVLSGFLARDIELRYTNNSTAVASIVIAVKRPHKDETDFIDCTAWRTAAENIAKYFQKGDFIQIRGYLTVEKYEVENDEGKKIKRSATKIIVEEFGFGGKKDRKVPEKPVETEANDETEVNDEFVPF